MHYYKKNIGDYHKKAGRLTMLQHGAYTLLIDACYDRERFPTLEQAIDWVWASNKEEIAAVEFVLSKFFTLSETGEYIQSRIERELEKYQENAATNKRIAEEREAKRRERSTNRARTVDEPPPNQEPRTTNQEPRTTNQEPRTTNTVRFQAPTLEDVRQYASEKGYTLDPERFINFYESKGWMVGKTKMKKWKAALSNWEKRNSEENKRTGDKQSRSASLKHETFHGDF